MPSIYMTVGFTVILVALLVGMLATANEMDLQDEDKDKDKEVELRSSSAILVDRASKIIIGLDKSVEGLANVLTSNDAFEADAFEESSFADDPLAIVLTPFQKKQHRQVEYISLVVRSAVATWLFLWVWW